jgi:hypothetical protein
VRSRQREQVVVRRTSRVNRPRLEQRANLVQRRLVIPIVLAVYGYVAVGRRVQPEDQPHRRRLTRPVRPEEARHDTGPNRECQAVDGTLVTVILCQAPRLDHLLNLARVP